jgi:hypothetical protein
MILQLNPSIPLDTPQGSADAHLVIDYGEQHNLVWVCFVRETGECWSFRNRDVRLERNLTDGIRCTSIQPAPPP